MLKIISYLVLVLFFICIVTAQTVPPPPANLTVEQIIHHNQIAAKLQWQYPAATNVQFRIYKAIDTLPFRFYQQVRLLNFLDQAVPSGHIYRYHVRAVVNMIESMPSNDVFFVPGIPPPPPIMVRGFIKGNIIDDNTNAAINGVLVRFFKLNGMMYWREVRTDSSGNYFAALDTGKYIISATKWTYKTEWYDNSLTREGATPVLISFNDTSYANFDLTKIPPPPPPVLVSVSGTVIDSISGLPLANASVAIMRTPRTTNTMLNIEGSLWGIQNENCFIPGIGTMFGVVRVVKTDANGNYTFNVPDSMTYIMAAAKPGYLPEFYNNKSSPFDADRLLIVGNTIGINFDLVPNPLVQNSLAGSVKNSLGDGVISNVILFRKSLRGLSPIRHVMSDSLGNFTFNYLYTGTYYAKAVPVAFYAPAWYDADSCGVLHWVNADSFVISGNTSGINICVLPIVATGFARISGTVNAIGNITTPVQGVTVFAISTTTNSVLGYDITEQNGNYFITDIAPGTYRIIVDKEGYIASEAFHIVSPTNNYTVSNANFTLTNSTLGVGDNDSGIPSEYYVKQNYPNPFNPTTEISFGLPTASKVEIVVYNLLGQQVATLFSGELTAGKHSISWNGKDNSGKTPGSGIYFYKINAITHDNIGKFKSVKKMILMK